MALPRDLLCFKVEYLPKFEEDGTTEVSGARRAFIGRSIMKAEQLNVAELAAQPAPSGFVLASTDPYQMPEREIQAAMMKVSLLCFGCVFAAGAFLADDQP